MVAIQLKQVSKSYNEILVLNKISFEIPKGSYFSLIGESGSGKTTCLELMNGLLLPNEGQVYNFEDKVTSQNATSIRRKMGYCIQGVGLFPHLTVEENISIIGRKSGWPQPQLEKRTGDLLEMVQLNAADVAKKKPRQLSGGQKQRVGLARALFVNPQILIMDEPFGALDPLTRVQIQDLILSLHKQMNLTIVMVTHDMSEALKMSDQILFLNNGRIEQQGTPQDFLDRPQTDLISQYIQTRKY